MRHVTHVGGLGLDYGADRRERLIQGLGGPPLYCALSEGGVRIARILPERGADGTA